MLKLSEHVRSTHNQDGGVVLDIRNGQMLCFNVVGSRMFELLKQRYSETRIAREISREFGVPPEIVETDLREFLTHLEKHDLLEPDTSGTEAAL
jgi:Coenzyme PQQ synthesis protein D (PqqD)